MAARYRPHTAPDDLSKISWPVTKRWQCGTDRLANSQRSDWCQLASLYDRINEMRRTDHHSVNIILGSRLCPQSRQCLCDPAGNVFAGGSLNRFQHNAVFNDHSICVGAANIDPNSSHA